MEGGREGGKTPVHIISSIFCARVMDIVYRLNLTTDEKLCRPYRCRGKRRREREEEWGRERRGKGRKGGEGGRLKPPALLSAEMGLQRALDDVVSSPGIFTWKETVNASLGARYRPSGERRLKDHVPGRSRPLPDPFQTRSRAVPEPFQSRSSHHILQIQPCDIHILHAHSPFSVQFSAPLCSLWIV